MGNGPAGPVRAGHAAGPRSRLRQTEEDAVLHAIWWIIVGLIAGGRAKAVVPGPEGGGCVGSVIVGLVGALIGGFVFTLLLGHSMGGFIGSIIVAFVGA